MPYRSLNYSEHLARKRRRSVVGAWAGFGVAVVAACVAVVTAILTGAPS